MCGLTASQPLYKLKLVTRHTLESPILLDAIESSRRIAGWQERFEWTTRWLAMDEILELATRLGERIAADPRGRMMADARAALDASLQDRQLLQDYEAQQRKMHELESAGKPIEPDDKRRLADLHVKVIGSSIIKNVLKAQADYLELMTLVSQRIEEAALGLAEEE